MMSCLSPTSPLTDKKIQNICGLRNTKAVYRMKKRLENSGTISYQSPRLIYATNCLSDEAIRESHLGNTYLIISKKTGAAYTFTYSKYKIEKSEVCDSFKNIIFNHSRRLTFNPSRKHKLSDVEAYYERMEH